MPGLPELPVEVHDPSRDTQRDGVRDKEAVYQTHRGPKRISEDRPPPVQNRPAVPLRYSENDPEPPTPI